MKPFDKMSEHLRAVNSWCLYDVGNSAFATVILAAVFPVYFNGMASSLPEGLPAAYLGYSSAGAMLTAALFAPLLGSIADVSGKRKHFLAFFTLIGVLSTGLLYTVDQGNWLRALLFYVAGSIGFSLSMIFYDALLPQLAQNGKTMDEISSRGYAFGYVGGGILLALNVLGIILLPGTIGYRISFLSVSLWWSLFSLPLFLYVPEPTVTGQGSSGRSDTIKNGVKRIVDTFGEIGQYRDLFFFLIAFWLYNDGVGTIMKLAAIYAAVMRFDPVSIIGALLLTQFVAAPFSVLFGRLAKRIGGKGAIGVGLVWYSLITIAAIFMSRQWHFWILAACVGMVQGGVQAISRSTFGLMIPKGKSGEFFGFYDISSKFSGVIGPFLFGVITHFTGSVLPGLGILLLFFLGGLSLLMRVNIEKGVASAQNSLAQNLTDQ
ncbi:MAG: Major facilitator superfamily MFS_1 [Synergistales bacterium 53_16]|jgi:UMF1 family MFS transporter|nr:MAG: Major facilitator superfamily MFS_1 [Synergistales bacterium 53_16]KUL05385.1 MAG: Major facilitator superfamily MFS_1 [Synergistales bacterium 54_9]MDK2845861.1 transporter, family [Synergistales bacterium]